tara:strand:- start:1898 stop:2674 length:777 start_codon:yes stop_codon:yes gene_type:complete
MKLELMREVRKWGNSAGVLLPKEWKGKEVKVVLVDRTSQIKKEVFDILSDYLEDILGIYLVGSYARKEQTKKSDIDIIVISKRISKEIISGKYHISIYNLESIKKSLKIHPITIYPRLIEAKPILNQSLLKELLSIKLNKHSFKLFIEDCKRIIKINKEFIEIDKLENSEYLDLDSTIYSLILRLRGIFLIKEIFEHKRYSKKKFQEWLEKEIKKEFQKAYHIYEAVRDDKKVKEKIKIETAEKILNLLKREVKKYDK